MAIDPTGKKEKEKETKNFSYNRRAITSWSCISPLILAINSSALSLIPCINGDANAKDSHMPSASEIMSLPSTISMLSANRQGSFASLSCGELFSMKGWLIQTGGGLFWRWWERKIRVDWIECLLCLRRGLKAKAGQGTALVVGLSRFVGFFMDLDLLSLWSSLVWSFLVKILHAFLAGWSLLPKFKKDIWEVCRIDD